MLFSSLCCYGHWHMYHKSIEITIFDGCVLYLVCQMMFKISNGVSSCLNPGFLLEGGEVFSFKYHTACTAFMPSISAVSNSMLPPSPTYKQYLACTFNFSKHLLNIAWSGFCNPSSKDKHTASN